MKTEQLLRGIFPEILADYFDVIDIQESISQIDFWLDERNFIPSLTGIIIFHKFSVCFEGFRFAKYLIISRSVF